MLGGERVGVREEDDVGRPLADQLGVLDCFGGPAQHAEGLVAHLVAVAVGAVQEIAAPPLPDTRDVGQHVVQTRGHEQPARRQDRSVGEPDLEARAGAGGGRIHGAVDERASVRRHLGPAEGQEVLGRQAVA